MVRRSDFKKDPIRMASLCYIEKGMSYAQKGENDRIENPTFERDEVFKEHFPLDVYLDLNAFFLKKFSEWHPLYEKFKVARKMIFQEKMETKEKS